MLLIAYPLGAAHNGTLGLRAVQANDGLTAAQADVE
jgi:hypothetical protein